MAHIKSSLNACQNVIRFHPLIAGIVEFQRYLRIATTRKNTAMSMGMIKIGSFMWAWN